MSNLGQVIAYLRPGITILPGGQCEILGESISVWRHQSDQPSLAEIAAAVLPAAKAERIEADREECRRRLVQHYGDALEQASRFAGGYGETAQANIMAGTVAARAASNVARDAILAIQDGPNAIQQLEAVTVAWPVLP